MLRLHHAPLACSLASRLALSESGLPHEVVVVRTWAGEQRTEAYRAINPRGKVPALETDEGVLTESTAILPYIADLTPEKHLIPASGTFARAQAQAWLSHLSSSLHPALSAALFPADVHNHEAARDAAFERVATIFSDIDRRLDGRDHVLDGFSVCDLYLLTFALWRGAPGVGSRIPALPSIDGLQQRLLSRPNILAIVAEDMKLRAEAR